jgi:excisionase family DNA binding protein
LADAEAALATAAREASPLPPRAELEALASDLRRLWEAPSTSHKDRKRLLRTLVADVTLISQSAEKHVRVGIRWRSGAREELVVDRLVRRLSAHSDEDLVAELNAAGFRTGTRRAFDIAAVRWVRFAHHIPSAPRLGPGELTVTGVAARLGTSESAIYYWIEQGHLEARRDYGGRLYVPFPPNVEEACRHRVRASVHMKPRTQTCAVGGAV